MGRGRISGIPSRRADLDEESFENTVILVSGPREQR